MLSYLKRFATLIKLPYFLLRHNKISVCSEIGEGTFLRDCKIGKWCHIGPRGNINSAIIGNYTCIAPSCQIGGMEHPYWDFSISPLLSNNYIFGKKTIIGNDVWIAADCIIRQGVTIGNGAVIGANSFVNKDIPPYAIAFGTPARVVKFRFNKQTITQLKQSRYWEQSPADARRILKTIANS